MKLFFYKTGNFIIVLLLFAHLYNNHRGLPIPVIDAQSRELTQLMKTYEIHFIGGWHTLNQTIWGYDITWALFIIFTFLVNRFVLRAKPQNRALLRNIAFANFILWGGGMIAALVFWSIPQQVFFIALTLCFGLSYWLENRPIKPKPDRICIVGAGAAGLTAAYQLKKQGYTHVKVLEKLGRIGGKCLTIDYEHRPFDFGGHEMLGGYNDVLDIAAEVGAPSRTSIKPLVYNKDQQQYLSFKDSMTALGYTNWQVMIASMRYFWLVLFKYRKFSNPASGFANTPPELMKPLEVWLKEKKLEALTGILMFVVRVQGYGSFSDTSAAYFVKFMGWRNWITLVLSGINISKKWPRVFVNGMESFLQLLANQVDVSLNVNITRIERKDNKVQVYLANEAKPQEFDTLIVCTPLDLATVSFMDLDATEREIFGKIIYSPMYSTACEVQGLPAGVVATVPLNDLSLGQYTGYIRDYENINIALFYSLSKEVSPQAGANILEEIKTVLAKLPPYQGVQPQLIKLLDQEGWNYFPHVSPDEYTQGFYNRLEELQGQKNTYYASSLFSFEVVGHTVAYSKKIIETYF
ncbi:MAG: FAD-dependent oxidoreductase [Microscillaceae bacterium]|nr:FAD-dependent oxidoreductase [Microscillaceae bacterium]